MVAFARKLSTGSSRELPPSYSKVDLTSVGLTLNDHLNPPPTYDRLIAMLESGEITSVPIHLHPEVVNEIFVLANEESDKFLITKVARFINFHHAKIPLQRNFGKWTFFV